MTALARLSRIAPLYALSTFYVSLIRGTPLLLQIFFFFLALPQLGIVLPGFVAGIMALSLNYGAYMSETFRAGIQGVGKGQREAALALGMTQGQMMRRIVLPQACASSSRPSATNSSPCSKTRRWCRRPASCAKSCGVRPEVGPRANFRSLEALLVVAAVVLGHDASSSRGCIQARLEKRLARGDR